MNKQELIEKFEERKTIIGNYQGYAVWWEDVKEIFEQLDEPETGQSSGVCGGFYRKTEKTGAYTILLNRRKHV